MKTSKIEINLKSNKMKTRITLLALAATFALALPSCKKDKKVEDGPKPAGEVIINEYCSGDSYKSTKDAFRSTATGESMDRETARKKPVQMQCLKWQKPSALQ